MALTLREKLETMRDFHLNAENGDIAMLGSERHLGAIRGAHELVRVELDSALRYNTNRVREGIEQARTNIAGFRYANQETVRAGRRREDEGALMEQVYWGAWLALSVL